MAQDDELTVGGCLSIIAFFALLGFIVFMLYMAIFEGGDGNSPNKAELNILASTESKALGTILTDAAKKENIELHVEYLGTLDIMLRLQGENPSTDAIWLANSNWITLSNNGKVKDSASIYRTPLVVAVKRSKATQLGWTSKSVTTDDIVQAISTGQVKLALASPAQSDAGAGAYFALLSSITGNPPVLVSDKLSDSTVKDKLSTVMKNMDRSSTDSLALKDVLLANYASVDGMFNYESLAIEANRKLLADGQEPLYVVYPSGGLTIADAPLAFVNRDAKNEEAFLRLQKRLLSTEVQKSIASTGRRTSTIGITVDNADASLFDPKLGFDTGRNVSSIRFPRADTVSKAQDLFQTLRAGSLTVYCTDSSGATSGAQEAKIKEAMRILLDPQEARRYSLSPSPQDITVVLLFDSAVKNRNEIDQWTVKGNDTGSLLSLAQKVGQQTPSGNSNLFACAAEAYRVIKQIGKPELFTSIVIVSDGEGSTGTIEQVKTAINETGLSKVPVFGITLESKATLDVDYISSITGGKLFKTVDDYMQSLRTTRRNN